MPALPLALARGDVADFVSALILVYTLLVIAWILQSMYFGFGGRMPYSRWSSGVIGFLDDTVGPFLAFFRRYIPQFGPLDLSPMVAILVLQFAGAILVNIIRG
ncbi:YggT family protein [Paraconexibacter antarcticus]|uniref:YggT family protein n=1 Tax=Paraconexibacter antarcticus TaxID=2949664 RepID=A0ABY5DQA0_9ACTN|nr:YggT family protein [Paraconexibacter antarcticus]UTI62895.1 YggT family protein [Paraconexibacter antarcticus]